MNMEVVEKIANAVLYEGYLLYPYRASAVKNQQRFNFGVLYPREHCELQQGSDAWQIADGVPGERAMRLARRGERPIPAVNHARGPAGGTVSGKSTYPNARWSRS